VHLNHGGTEMGQGLHQGRAGGGGRVPDRSRPGENHRDDDGQGAEHLTDRGLVRRRPQRHGGAERRAPDQGPADRFRCGKIRCHVEQVVFLPNRVRIGNSEIPFNDLVKQAYMARVQLSAAGFYKTPKIHWDRVEGQGPSVLLLRLWRGLLGGVDRHADRRICRRTHRHPARYRPVAEPRSSIIGQVEAASSRAWAG
jgi:hypothetical protein